jgi:hypothetical protein
MKSENIGGCSYAESGKISKENVAKRRRRHGGERNGGRKWLMAKSRKWRMKPAHHGEMKEEAISRESGERR